MLFNVGANLCDERMGAAGSCFGILHDKQQECEIEEVVSAVQSSWKCDNHHCQKSIPNNEMGNQMQLGRQQKMCLWRREVDAAAFKLE